MACRIFRRKNPIGNDVLTRPIVNELDPVRYLRDFRACNLKQCNHRVSWLEHIINIKIKTESDECEKEQLDQGWKQKFENEISDTDSISDTSGVR